MTQASRKEHDAALPVINFINTLYPLADSPVCLHGERAGESLFNVWGEKIHIFVFRNVQGNSSWLKWANDDV